jgi:hypothetical protein
MQPTRTAPFVKIWTQSFDLLNQQLAAAIDLQLWLLEMLHPTVGFRGAHSPPTRSRNDNTVTSARLADLPGPVAGIRVAACDMNDRIGIWVNEGGAGGEVNR